MAVGEQVGPVRSLVGGSLGDYNREIGDVGCQGVSLGGHEHLDAQYMVAGPLVVDVELAGVIRCEGRTDEETVPVIVAGGYHGGWGGFVSRHPYAVYADAVAVLDVEGSTVLCASSFFDIEIGYRQVILVGARREEEGHGQSP